jgi:hypothetical protein
MTEDVVVTTHHLHLGDHRVRQVTHRHLGVILVVETPVVVVHQVIGNIKNPIFNRWGFLFKPSSIFFTTTFILVNLI